MMAKFKVGDRVKHRSSVTGSVADVLPSGNYYVRLDRPAFPGDDCMWAFGESELSPLPPAIPAGWTPAGEPPDGIRDVLVMLKGGEKRLGWYSESAIISGGNWYLYPEGTTPKSIDDDDTSFDDTPAAPGEVLAWCEIEPEPEHPHFGEYITINGRGELMSGAHYLKTITELSFVDARNEGEYVGVYRKVGDTSPSGVMGQVEPSAKRDPRVRYVVVAIPTLYDTLEEAELHAQRAVESLRVNVVIARVVEEVKPGKPEVIRMEE